MVSLGFDFPHLTFLPEKPENPKPGDVYVDSQSASSMFFNGVTWNKIVSGVAWAETVEKSNSEYLLPKTRVCSYCRSSVPIAATNCKNCGAP